jgi:two-component system NtrC family sensor kinase
MKLFYKVYLLLILVLILILASAEYISYRREIALFNSDMENDALLLGKALAGMAENALKVAGEAVAVQLIRDANSKEGTVAIRWVDLDRSSGRFAPAADPEKLAAVRLGNAASMVVEKTGGDAFRLTYVPISSDARPRFAIELSESLAMLKRYTRNSRLHLTVTAMVLFLSSGGILWFSFKWWIHRPLLRFIDKSRRIGAGDLSQDLVVEGRDEFAELAKTLNAMCRDLDAGRNALIVENQRRIQAFEQLRHAERLSTLGRLSAGMAHELGTPLNVIYGRAKLIRANDLPADDIVDCARIIGEQTERITKIIQGLLDFSRRKKPLRSRQDMETLVRQVLDMLTQPARKAKVSFNLIQNGDLPTVFIDPIQVQQVITNIVMNGIQAMDGGGRLDVALTVGRKPRPYGTRSEARCLMIAVKDEGPGIPPDRRAHLFEPFYTTKEVGAGTGLGLSIAYGIIEEHGGWIDVESEPGEGACFTVHLPLEAETI